MTPPLATDLDALEELGRLCSADSPSLAAVDDWAQAHALSAADIERLCAIVLRLAQSLDYANHAA